MIRILLNIKHFSPFLRTMNGEINVEHIDYRNVKTSDQVKKILECKFHYKPGQLGFESIEGFKNYIFEALKTQIDIMIRSYAAGMSLAAYDVSWVEDSLDRPLYEWLEEKRTKYDNICDKYGYYRKGETYGGISKNSEKPIS